MKSTLEREIKLQAPPGFSLPQFPGTPIGPRRFTSTYLDTEDFRLAGAGITLRRRVENRRGLWQLKLPRGNARVELEERGGPLRPPPSFARLLTAPLMGHPLKVVAKLRTLRTGTTVMDGDLKVAEVVFDSVQVLQGITVVNRFSEIEVELLDGTEEDLRQLGSALKSLGAFAGDDRPKLYQALDIAIVHPDTEKRPVSELAQIQGMISDQFRLLLRHDPGTRLGGDPEDLHQHRVGIRKLRSLLASARMLEPEWSAALRAELEWIGDLMNPVRDLDVMVPYLRADMALLDPAEAAVMERFISSLGSERDAARKEMLEGLESERYLELLRTLEAATVSLVVRPAEDDLQSGAARQFRKMRKAARNLSSPPADEDLHRVRRLAKKARYTADLMKPTGGKKVAKYLADIKQLQEVLGDFQDSVVAEDRIKAFLPEARTPQESFVLGRMAELQASKKRRVGSDFPPAWRRVSKSGSKTWF